MNQTERDLANKVECPYCHAQPGQPCTNKETGQPLEFAPAHTPRTMLAEQEMLPF